MYFLAYVLGNAVKLSKILLKKYQNFETPLHLKTLKVEFDAGEVVKAIQIEVLDDSKFDTTLLNDSCTRHLATSSNKLF